MGVLFSGGIDSVLLAALLHRVLSDEEEEEEEEEQLLLLPMSTGRNTDATADATATTATASATTPTATAAVAIDLINVTFDKSRPLVGDQSVPGGGTVSPDRAASIAALTELQACSLTVALTVCSTGRMDGWMCILNG